jgi:hypothetical protein
MPVLSDLARAGLIELLPIDGEGAERFLAANRGFKPALIPSGTYRGIGNRRTLAVNSIWVTAAGIDAVLVHDITEALWREGNRALLDGGHPMGLRIRRESALDDLPIPLHDGARQYYREEKLIN